MTTRVADLLIFRLQTFNPQNPLEVIDIMLVIGVIVIFLIYMSRLPTFRVILGLLFLALLAISSFVFNLIFTGFLIGFITLIIFVSLPLIFAPEIRHYLEKIGRFSFLKLSITEKQRNDTFIKNLVAAIYEMAERKIGATIVIQRKTGLGQTIDTGVIIDAKFGSKLLSNIFFPKSPLHDGAVIIKDGRILAVGCLLPISGEVKLDPPFGTRHRAGLTLTRDTDAVVILISEQRGEVSLAENGKLDINLDRIKLIERLEKLLS